MTTPAINSQGAKLARAANTSSPYGFANIPGLSNIRISGPNRQEIEVTDLDSVAKEFLMDLPDYGQITADMNFNPDNATHALLRADITDETPRRFRITFPDGSPATTYTFEAFVMSTPVDLSRGQAVKGTLTLRVTGPITEA